MLSVNARRGIEPREGVVNDEDVCESVTRSSSDSFYKSHVKAHVFYGPLLQMIKQLQVQCNFIYNFS